MKTTEIEALMQSMQQLLDSIISNQTVTSSNLELALALSKELHSINGTTPDIHETISCDNCRYCGMDTIDGDTLICRLYCLETLHDNVCNKHEREV